MSMMTEYEAARRVYERMGRDPKPETFCAGVMEGRHIPEGTFDGFVRECEAMGMRVHSYWLNEMAVISGR